MPINREPQSIDEHGTEESAVRRSPLDQDDAYELQDHEFTLVVEEPLENGGWPFDEHTAPWSKLPPLPAWATKARELLEPPTLPRPLNDDTPTLAEDDGNQFSATALRVLREELARSTREARAQQEQIEQLERSLASALQARAEAELKRGETTAELLERVQGQAARIAELEAAIRALQVERVEPVVEEKPGPGAHATDGVDAEAKRSAGTEATTEPDIALEVARASPEVTTAPADAEARVATPEETASDTADAEACVTMEDEIASGASDAEVRATMPDEPASDPADAEAHVTIEDEIASGADAEVHAAMRYETVSNASDAEARAAIDDEIASDASDAEASLAAEQESELEHQGVASDSDSDLETTVEWITNAAPSVELTIEIDANDDCIELTSDAAANGETTLEIDPDADLIEVDSTRFSHSELVETESTSPATGRPKRKSSGSAKRRPVAPNDLKQIAGIGKRLEQRLHAKGIRTFAQIAALRPSDLARVAKQIGVSPERVAREGWVGQARKLKKRASKRSTKRPTRAASRRTRKS